MPPPHAGQRGAPAAASPQVQHARGARLLRPLPVPPHGRHGPGPPAAHAQDTLRAASLALLFLTPNEEAYGRAVRVALQKALHPIASGSGRSAREMLEKLLVDNPDYGRLVTKEVQVGWWLTVGSVYRYLPSLRSHPAGHHHLPGAGIHAGTV